jgi:hypothetical protein
MPHDTLDPFIHTAGIRTAAIFAALFNAACKIGHGEKDSGPNTITLEEASAILKSQPKGRNGKKLRYFDYLHGKRLKLDLSGAYIMGIVAAQYDFYYGQGMAKRTIKILRATGDPCHPEIIALQAMSRVAVSVRVDIEPKQTGTITEGNLAGALDLTDPGEDPESESRKHEYRRLQKIPCTTFNL